MMRIARTLRHVLVAGALLPGGGSSKAWAPQANGAVHVCALLAPEEVAAIVGAGIPHARISDPNDGPAECHYKWDRQSVTIRVDGNASKAKWDAFLKKLEDVGEPLEPVASLGDGAFFRHRGLLYALAGTHVITVHTATSLGVDAAKTRVNAMALARAAITKLQ